MRSLVAYRQRVAALPPPQLLYSIASNKTNSSYSRDVSASPLSQSCRAYSGGYRGTVQSQPYTNDYITGGPTLGPLGQSANAVRVTPRRLKAYLDKYVIGQERAKKTLSVAVYSHYKRIDELILNEQKERTRLAAEEIQRKQYERTELMMAQGQADLEALQTSDSGPDQSEQQRTVRYVPPVREPPPRDPFADTSKVVLEKANVLCLGPTGVGKTHILKTLAKALDVPFSMSDCTPFTQAGYVGEDASVCVERLLQASNWDVARAETGIICLDEIDKLAKTVERSTRDVGGAGVQQALLKIIEGTELTISAKSNRGNFRNGGAAGRFPSNFDNSPWQQQKPEEYTVRTDNILFICTGAFTGLQEVIMKRLAKGSLGFNATIKDKLDMSHQMTLTEEDAKEHFRSLPYYSKANNSPSPVTPPGQLPDPTTYNPLDLVTPQDLQDYGMIPEFLGRIPITTALSPFSIPQLMRVLTEPRNSIISQYIQEFSISGTELKFTSLALWEIAKAASKLGTGARALRGIVENVLAEAKFEVPGSSARYVLVTHAAAKREGSVLFFSRGCSSDFKREWDAEEREWKAMLARTNGKAGKKEYTKEPPEAREEIMNKSTGIASKGIASKGSGGYS